MIEVICIGNKIYKINKTIDESENVYKNRCWMIIRHIEKNKLSVIPDEIITLSLVWRNITYKGMTYSSKIIKKVNDVFH
jgi:hypothetical protein